MAQIFVEFPSNGSVGIADPVPTLADLPASGTVVGQLIVTQDTGVIYEWNGSSWVAVTSGGAVGDVTGPASSVNNQAAVFSGTTGKVIKASTATGVAKLASGVLSASQVNLASEVTGTLPIANGGTNSTTALSNSKVIVSVGGALVESATTTTQLGFLDATSSIQTQLNARALAARNINTTAPLSGGGDLSADRTFAISQSTTSTDGYLSSADWNTFNGKQPAGSYITALTGDVTAAGPGSAAATLATVNSNVGSFGDASHVSAVTVNAKGLVTAAASTSIQITESQVTNLVSDLAAKQSTTLTNAHLLVGNGSNVATDVAAGGDVSLANTGAFTVNSVGGSTASNINLATTAVNAGPSKQLFVDTNHPGSYTPDGSILRPFKTISAAIAQIITNADNSTFAYSVTVFSGNYNETLTFNSAALFNIAFVAAAVSQGQIASVSFGPGSGTAITSTSNNTQLQSLSFSEFTINGDIIMTGDTNGTNFGGQAIVFVGCNIQKDSSGILLTNINNVYFYSCATNSTGAGPITFNNLAFALVEEGDGLKNGTTVNLTDNPGGNVPAQYSGNYLLVERSTLSATINVDAGSELDTVGGFMGGGTVTMNGTWHSYGTVIASPVVLNSGSTFRNRGSSYSNTFTVNGGATVVNQGHYLYTPTTSANWNTVPTVVDGALDTLAVSGVAKSQTQNLTLASPNGSSGLPTFRALVAADLPTGNLTDAGTDGITVTGGTGAVIGGGTSFSQHVADTTHNGYLSSTDWNTFNGKQPAGSYITALTGDVTASGPGNAAATIAAGAVTNAKIAAAAGISVNKLAALTVSSPVRSDASGFLTTGATSLTSEVTGVLPIANGGTNSSTALASNFVMVSSAGKIVESATTTTSLGFLDATSSIQGQFNAILSITSIVAVSTNVTLTNKAVHLVDTTSALSLTLPSPTSTSLIIVKDSTGSANLNNITIVRAGSEKIETIAASFALDSSLGSWTFISDGVDWWIV